MTIDWLARLREQGRFARKMAAELPVALSAPQLTSAEAEQLRQTVENCAASFDAIVAEMKRVGLDASYMSAAETVSILWSDLSILAADASDRLQPRRRVS